MRSGSFARPAMLLVAILVLSLGYAAFFSQLAIARHQALRTHTADLGQIDQAIWNTAQGRFVQEVKGEALSTRLTDHFEPFFGAVSVLFHVWDDVRALLILQAAALGLSAPLVCVSVVAACGKRDRLSWLAGSWAALAYLLAPQAQAAAVADFHAVPLAGFLAVLCFYLVARGKTAPALIAGLLAMSVKEEVALLVLAIGLYGALSGKLKAGWVLAALSVIWFSVSVFVIIPHYSAMWYGRASSPYLARYQGGTMPAGQGMRGVLGLARELLAKERLCYVGGLFLAFAGMPALAPEVAAISGPLLLANVASNYQGMFSGEMHYSSPFMPLWAVAGGLGMRRLLHAGSRRGLRSWATAFGLTVIPFGYHMAEGYSPIALEYYLVRAIPQRHDQLLSRFARQIPPRAALSVTTALHPHFAHRQRLYTFPAVADADFVLLDVTGTTDMHPADLRKAFDRLVSRGYGVADAADGFVLLQRGSTGHELGDEFFSFASLPDDGRAALAQFGGVIELVSYEWLDDPKRGLTKLRLCWRVLGQAPTSWQPYVLFSDEFGNVVTDTMQMPFVEPFWLTTDEWRPGRIYITTTVFVPLPSRSEAYVGCAGVDGNRLQLDAVAAPSLQAIPELGLVRLPPVSRGSRLVLYRLAESPQMAAQNCRGLEGGILFCGTWLPGRVGAGSTLAVRTSWAAGAPLQKAIMLSIRLQDAGGALVAQVDGPFHGGLLPTTRWVPGELIWDEKKLQVPPGIAPGDYEVVGVAYDLHTLQPLTVPGGEWFVRLGRVRVEGR